jgi:dihydrofolate reductase
MGIDGPGKRFDTVLEGRSSYEVGLAAGITNAYPHLRHLVFSSTMRRSPDPTVELVTADPAETARSLKLEDGLDIWVVGGGKLAHALRLEWAVEHRDPRSDHGGVLFEDQAVDLGYFDRL